MSCNLINLFKVISINSSHLERPDIQRIICRSSLHRDFKIKTYT